MPTATKMTFDRLEASRRLLARVRSQDEHVAEDLTARLAPLLEEGEEMPDLRQLLRLLERLLERQRGSIAATNSTRSLDADTLTVLLRRRDAAARRLYTELVNVRRAVIGCFGRDIARSMLPLSGRTPRHAGRLRLVARSVIDRFSDPARELPAPTVPGVELRPELWAQRLQPHLDELSEILERIDTARGKALGSVLSKPDALAEFDITYGRVARFLETFWDLADGPYRSRGLRLIVHRRRGASSAAEKPSAEVASSPAAAASPSEPGMAQIAVSRLGEPVDEAFAAEPAPAAAEASAPPRGGWMAWLKGKWGKTRLQEPAEANSRVKAPSRAVRSGFPSAKSSQHLRPTPLRRPKSTRHQRLSASRRPPPSRPPRLIGLTPLVKSEPATAPAGEGWVRYAETAEAAGKAWPEGRRSQDVLYEVRRR